MSEWKSLAWNVYKDLYLMRRALAFYSAMVLVFAARYSGWNLGPLTLGAAIVARGGAEMSPASALPMLGLTAILAAAALVPAGISLWAFFRWGYQAARHAVLAFVVVVLGVVMPLSERLPTPRVTSRDLAMGMVTQGSGPSGWAVDAATSASLALYLLAAVAA